jgi:GT2 family glycosyltransferase
VADDGSSDDSREVAEQFASSLNLEYKFQEDRGYRPASARNMGIRAAEGKLCVFFDAGIIPAEDCLQTHFAFHASQQKPAAVIGSIYGLSENEEMSAKVLSSFDPDRPAWVMQQMMQSNAFADVREMHFQLHHDKIDHLPMPWTYFWSGHISVPRKSLLQVGMFDEGFDGKWGIEDNELGYRLHKAGIPIHLLREAACFHYPHHSHREGKEAQGRDNCEYFHNKFKTPETELFLRHFGATEFIDLNAIFENDKCPV